MAERVLVTGGSGYFGSLLIANLVKRGYAVRSFDLVDAHDRPADVEFIQGDIRDLAAVKRAVEGVDIIHHNVAMVPLAKDKAAFLSVNFDGTRNLLEAALDAAARKVVNTSSSAIFGVPAKNPVDDQTPPNPGEAYGKAKLMAENLCRDYVRKGLDVTVIRPRTIMGHGRLGIMQILFEWIRLGRNIPVFNDGGNVYQFVHADDLAAACILAGERSGASTYNIGAEKFGSLRETLQGLLDHARTGSRIRSVPMWPAIFGMKITSSLGISPLGAYHSLMYGRSMYFDIARPKAELGWSPRYSNVEMFIESYEWYLSHRDAVLSSHGESHHRSAVKHGVLDLVSRLL
jgi:nucleoside-diphosphate-sugar epimerase